MVILRVIASIFIMEFFNHLTIVFSMHENSKLVERASKFTIAFALLIKGALFSVKYIVFYGIPNIFNEIVGIKTTPLPRCIALISTNGEMWKYFDTGIYEFIKKYEI